MFRTKVSSSTLSAIQGDVLVMGLFQREAIQDPFLSQIDGKLNRAISRLLKNREFEPKLYKTEFLHVQRGLLVKRVLLIGLGEKKRWTLDTARKVAGTAAREVTKKRFRRMVTLLQGVGINDLQAEDLAQAMVEGTAIGEYRFEAYKTEDPKERAVSIQSLTLLAPKGSLLQPIQRGARRGSILAECQRKTRDIVNRPANEITPQRLARIAKEEGKRWGIDVQTLSMKQMERLGMGGLLSVGRGSTHPPQFIIMEHAGGDRREAPVVIVGKGITFDSGGLSLKPSGSMETMKYDKAGAVATLYTVVAASRLKIPHRVVGLMAVAENLPSGSAYKPGDVVRTMSGKTIEVLNTDAEGRVVLSDALTYAERYKPKAVIDMATLTGACVVALGYEAIGMMGRDDAKKIKAALVKAGEYTGERVWELPLWKEYGEAVKSKIADVKNIGNRAAGTITAAAFLSHFTEKYPWVHLDIAGMGWAEESKPFCSTGPTGCGVRLIAQYLLESV